MQRRQNRRRKQEQGPHASSLADAVLSAPTAPDAQRILEAFVAEQRLLTNHQPPRASRILAELVDLLNSPHLLTPDALLAKVNIYLTVLQAHVSMPQHYRYYPRKHVPAGSGNARPYEETYFRVESFSPKEYEAPIAASGFGAFNPDSGQFTMVAVSHGNKATIGVGPTLKIETDAAADVLLAASILLDYQYTLSAKRNPASAPGNDGGYADAELWFRPVVSAFDKTSGVPLPEPSLQPWSMGGKSATLEPGLKGPAYTTPGGREVSPGTSVAGGLSAPLALKFGWSLPANARCEVSVVCWITSDASGPYGPVFGFLGFADTRASGQFPSADLWLFT
jgi:hypothetical protein